MPLASILEKYREAIVGEWVRRLHESVSRRYSERPPEELAQTVAGANDGSYAVLVNDDYSVINNHIEWITRLRLNGGFSLSEVQNAYELYRTILLPILLKELSGDELLKTMSRLNECLFYTITRFSNYFQSLHEEQIHAHTKDLEREVEKRTGELAESESKYRILVEEIDDGYFVNQGGRIVFANRAFCDLHGYTPEEMTGKAYAEIVAERSLAGVRKLYERRAAGEDSKNPYVYLRLHKNGDSLPTENRVKGIMYRGKYAVAGICRDITERIKTERRIREAERFAHIGKLTTSLAHEIRNPLCSVKLNSQVLLRSARLDGNDKRRMEIIVHETSRLERILDGMLDFAKPLEIRLQSGLIKQTIDACLQTMEVRIREKQIGIKRRYSNHGLGPILFDGERMEQALINVLINSVDAVEKGGTICVSTKVLDGKERSLMIEISDNGAGIAPEDMPYVFDPFFSSKKQGTGLGLVNVKKIVEAHGGRVEAAARKHGGAVFRLTLPVKEGS